MKRSVKRVLRRYAVWAGALAVFWVLLWDQVSVANVVGGVAVALLMLIAFPLPPVTVDDRRLHLRPVAVLPLAFEIVKDLLVSNVLVTRLTLSPRRGVHTGIVACELHTESQRIAATVANIAALTPGSMAVEALRDPSRIYIHVLDVDDPEAVRRRIAHLERLVIDFIGSRRDRAAIAAAEAEAERTAPVAT